MLYVVEMVYRTAKGGVREWYHKFLRLNDPVPVLGARAGAKAVFNINKFLTFSQTQAMQKPPHFPHPLVYCPNILKF